jgi:hypothetical protein
MVLLVLTALAMLAVVAVLITGAMMWFNYKAANDLAWLLATSSVITVRDGKEAVVLAKKACELDAWKHSATIDTLAAAFAEAGDFTEAIKYQRQALSMPDVTDKYRAEAQQRLDLYQQEKPYHGTAR